MNLQVNFILDTELRSGSTVSQKFALRVVAVVVPVVILLVFLGSWYAVKSKTDQLTDAKAEFERKKPMYNSVMNLQQELRGYGVYSGTLEGWGASRLEWHTLLNQLAQTVPPSVQLTRLQANELIDTTEGASLRRIDMFMKGKVRGEEAVAAAEVQALNDVFTNTAYFKQQMEKSDVRRYVATDNTNEPNVRLFDIECKFNVRKISAPEPPPSTNTAPGSTK